MSVAAVLPLKFQIGARTLASIPRRLQRVPLALDDVLAERLPALPQLDPASDGFLVTSWPAHRLPALAAHGLIAHVRQRYTRYYVDLAEGETAWLARLSANTRSALKRKTRKLTAMPGFAIRRYATPDEIAAFHPLARAVSAETYQERLLDAGLPADPGELLRLAAADRLRAWLLSIGEAPIAYLCCSAEGDTLRYDHVGHDQTHGALSPGAVLQAEALRDMFAEGRFARFDFTEGEGQHKRGLASGGVACLDLLLLRPTLTNRAALAALGAFDAGLARLKRLAAHPMLARMAKRVRR